MVSVPFRLDRSVTLLFGSETRARVLALLANAREPKTAYAISRAIEVRPPKVYKELAKLASVGIVGTRIDESGRRRYFLADEDLRTLLLRRVRLAATDDWFSPARLKEVRTAMERTKRLKVDLPAMKANPSAVPNWEEFQRAPEKDRALKRLAAPRPRRPAKR